MRLHESALRVLVAIGCGAAVGCAGAPPQRPMDLARLERGGLTEHEVRDWLGEPSAAFDADHVLAYRLALRGANAVILLPEPGDAKRGWHDVTHSLVLAFAPDGTLERYELVPVDRAPSR